MGTGTLIQLKYWFESLNTVQKIQHCPLVPPDRWPSVTFVSQPARSPDLNALDLGAWWSLEKAVGEVAVKRDNETWIEAVTRRVFEAWKIRDAELKCAKIFSTLKMVWAKILEVNGRNDFTIPHQLEKEK